MPFAKNVKFGSVRFGSVQGKLYHIGVEASGRTRRQLEGELEGNKTVKGGVKNH